MPDRVLPDETRQAFAEAEDVRDRAAMEVALDELGEQIDAARIVADRLSERLGPILLPDEPQEDSLAEAVRARRQSPLAEQIERRAFDARALGETLRRILSRIDL